MYPNNGEVPLDLSLFPRLEGVLDMIYNPSKTGLLLDAERLGIPHIGGLSMLVAQAKLAAEIFTGDRIEEGEIDRITGKIARQSENIILIGMAGCGKTTVGKVLAERMGRELIDTDRLVTEQTGRTPSDIIEKEGEETFRRIETECVAMAGKLSGKIIATGGGVPTVKANHDLLRQNGIIVFLRRETELLDTHDRPLSQKTSPGYFYYYHVTLYL